MAAQKTQRGDKVDKVSSLGIIVSFLVIYATLAFASSFLVSPYIGSLLLANLVSFFVVGVVSFYILQWLLPRQMSLVDTFLLHELAKRKLIEFRES